MDVTFRPLVGDGRFPLESNQVTPPSTDFQTPKLLANPISWGKPGRLSNVEAFAVSLIIFEQWEQARSILQPFKFGDEFFNLNRLPLEAYSQAKTNAELAELQWEFFDKPDQV